MKTKNQIDNGNKFKNKSRLVRGCIGAAGLALILSSAPAYAVKPGNPPADSGRAVVIEADEACQLRPLLPPTALEGLEEIKKDACDLLYATNGLQDETSRGCDAQLANTPSTDPTILGGHTVIPWTDTPYTTYLLRNCDKNEAAQQRKAASVILSIEDKAKGKEAATTAAGYACDYASKAMILEAVDKLVYGTDADGIDVDLAADATKIMEDLKPFGSLVDTCD